MILFVFDIDGTLTDSVSAHQTSYLRALSDMGITRVNTHWEGYRHHTDSWVFAEIFRDNFGRHPLGHERAEFSSQITRCFLNSVESQPFGEIPGAHQYLDRIQASPDMGFALATGSLRPTAIRKFNQLGVQLADELLVSASEFESREGIVLSAIAAARRYYQCSDFEQVISVGDGCWDANTAAKLGLEFIGIGSGASADRLAALGVQNIFPDFSVSEMIDPNDWVKIQL